jgi:hypothetical protein
MLHLRVGFDMHSTPHVVFPIFRLILCCAGSWCCITSCVCALDLHTSNNTPAPPNTPAPRSRHINNIRALCFLTPPAAAAAVLRRRVILLVQAGAPVDATVDNLCKYMEPGDIIIDGGNEW